jgi:hypothetical protein
MVLFGAIGLVAGFLWYERLQTRFAIVAAVALAACVGTWFLERSIVTDRERVEQSIDAAVAAFERQDIAGVLAYISPQAPELQLIAAAATADVSVTNVHVTDVNVEIPNVSVPRATCHFRVNADARSRIYQGGGHIATRWQAKWQKEGDRWRILDLEQLNPLSGESIGDFRRYYRGSSVTPAQ